MGRVLGVDVGERRIGLAVSDPSGTTAHPHSVLERTKEERDVAAILAIAREQEVTEAVVGLPLRLDGSRGPAAEAAGRFAGLLERAGLAVRLWDERLTTVAAERSLAAAGVRGRARRRVVDKVAAALILQNHLDSRR
jgi:putative Holliday junction resolvase